MLVSHSLGLKAGYIDLSSHNFFIFLKINSQVKFFR